MPKVKDEPTKPQRKLAQPVPRWVKRQVSLFREEGRKLLPWVVEAEVLGMLAVSNGYGTNSNRWTISSLTTGFRVMTVDELADAKRCAEWLWSRFPDVWRLRTRDDMVAAIRLASEDTVLGWIVTCHAERRWLDPADHGLGDLPPVEEE